MFFIYILELENNKYYIGKTNNKNFMLDNITEKLYINKPIRILEFIPNYNDNDIYKYTNIYIQKYGKDNVQSELFNNNTKEIHNIEEEILSPKNKKKICPREIYTECITKDYYGFIILCI